MQQRRLAAPRRSHQRDEFAGRDLERSGIKVSHIVRLDLSPTRCILDHVKETDPDCIAIASQGRGLSRIFLGSVADKLIRSAGRPVLVLRPPKPG